MANEIKIFVSYSHKDEKLCEELREHLKFLERQHLSVVWYDRIIGAGDDWANAIDDNLNTSHIILLLISKHFMASNYCNDVEVKRAMERHEAGEARVIPVILSPVHWEGAPFSKLNALPPFGKSILRSTKYAREKALREVADGIYEVIKKLVASPLVSPTTSLRCPDSESLHKALLNLNYLEQVRVFRQSLRGNCRVGAFLIHGELEHGQKWLLNRLVILVPDSNVGKPPFKFVFQRQVGSRSLEALWRGLGKWVNPVKPPNTPLKIVEQIHALWQYQTIILILNGIDLIDEQYVNTFIEGFWEPLMNIVQSKPYRSQDHYLLMFLIDNEGCVDEWKVPFVDQLDQTWKPHLPIRLRKITRLTDNILSQWIDHEVNALPPNLTAPNILANTNGVPQIVIERICELCGHDWDERGNVWMKY